ncbi:hypothetical protein [Frankia sp. AgKG'84/4]|uniref:hypothetical protein n=1 Tax=Frankia sp. AgKG'84/4 TaxID=573490 RepID=UPI00200F64CE|nr:hypothetical protein [Frankia sp. AgKG'84/4]MCL9794050.1 hypothetical protein [Frankia sp. AgKG'84/4]
MTPADDDSTRTTGQRGGLLFGAISFEPGGNGLVREAVVAFRSAADADRYASEHGWAEHQVCPLRFLVGTPPADNSGMVRGGALGHPPVRRQRRVR